MTKDELRMFKRASKEALSSLKGDRDPWARGARRAAQLHIEIAEKISKGAKLDELLAFACE